MITSPVGHAAESHCEGKYQVPEAPLQIDLGCVETLIGSLQFTFLVSPEGDAHLEVCASNPSGAGKGDVLMMLDANGFEHLKKIVRGADGLIDRMIREGRIKRMVLPY